MKTPLSTLLCVALFSSVIAYSTTLDAAQMNAVCETAASGTVTGTI
jgi:hypothetical protein